MRYGTRIKPIMNRSGTKHGDCQRSGQHVSYGGSAGGYRIQGRPVREKVVLVLGLTVWETNSRRWQHIVKGLSENEDLLVIVHTHIYHGNLIVGTRKIGPRLFFTNRIDLFSEVGFDQVVYCGSTDHHPYIRSDRYWADSLCYHEQQLNGLIACNDKLQVLDRMSVSQTVRHICSSIFETSEMAVD